MVGWVMESQQTRAIPYRSHADGNPLIPVVSIGAGGHHSLFVRNDGTVWAAGKNSNGQLSDGTTTERSNPVKVKKQNGSYLTGVVSVSGNAFSTFLKSNGTVLSAGHNNDVQLGDGSNVSSSFVKQATHVDGSYVTESRQSALGMILLITCWKMEKYSALEIIIGEDWATELRPIVGTLSMYKIRVVQYCLAFPQSILVMVM